MLTPDPTIPPIPPLPPKEFWDDLDWADAHMDEISTAHPNQWVAIVDRKVVASGTVLADVEVRAMALASRKEFPVLYAEFGIRVYAHLPAVPDKD